MIKIIAPCDNFHHYDQPIQEFIKRLGKTVELKKLKPSKKKSINEMKKEDTLAIEKVLEKEKGYCMLLSVEWELMKTESFAKSVEYVQAKYANLIFVIGGAYGLDESIIESRVQKKLSFSPMTFPHAQAIMMLLEQIYRVDCIKKWTKYHH